MSTSDVNNILQNLPDLRYRIMKIHRWINQPTIFNINLFPS
ncbi:hypothetical protein HMPREF3038_02002 [Akkermansia sp. KLE1797]|nr:hypothetical protein HMPREF3038_02002 [Akkermansia sp. KLE1797]KXU54724.1 hypothetical protein HMPREF3039_01197 [Akkermansia sp. KLE1798]KZA06068.1 hypothetical protein HMPREF1326_00332 [Akkermansia sp. KLE1605]